MTHMARPKVLPRVPRGNTQVIHRVINRVSRDFEHVCVQEHVHNGDLFLLYYERYLVSAARIAALRGRAETNYARQSFRKH